MIARGFSLSALQGTIMLTLPEFEMVQPKSFEEAVSFLASPSSMPIAGGTDLVPNMKHGLFSPSRVVDLKSIEGGREVEITESQIRIGALCTLDTLSQHEELQKILPSLSKACGLVAGPQLRRMGTIGGNICLDTRCVYYNQTYFWRDSLGFCLKKDGTLCHVVASGKKCVAAASNDTAPVLIALGAKLLILSSSGEREVLLDKFYVADGIKNTSLQSGELVRAVLIPRPKPQTKMSYEKLRTRQAIDFPMLSMAVVAEHEGETISSLRIVLNALASRPRDVAGLTDIAVGKTWTKEVIEKVAAQVYRQAHPLTNILGDTAWRREMAPVLLRRAVLGF
jgi:4-hydroxybenzoyl-CoA reductase subunit beta